MKARHVVKGALKLVIDADGNLITLCVRASKKEIFRILDLLIPDDEPVKP